MIFLAIKTDRHSGKHPEFYVSKWGIPLGRYSRTAYATNLLAVKHPIPDTDGDRPYSINVDDVEFGYDSQNPDPSVLLTGWPDPGDDQTLLEEAGYVFIED